MSNPWSDPLSRVTVGWEQLSALTDAGGGVDFCLRVDDQYPLIVNDVHPVYLVDTVENP